MFCVVLTRFGFFGFFWIVWLVLAQFKFPLWFLWLDLNCYGSFGVIFGYFDLFCVVLARFGFSVASFRSFGLFWFSLHFLLGRVSLI